MYLYSSAALLIVNFPESHCILQVSIVVLVACLLCNQIALYYDELKELMEHFQQENLIASIPWIMSGI